MTVFVQIYKKITNKKQKGKNAKSKVKKGSIGKNR